MKNRWHPHGLLAATALAVVIAACGGGDGGGGGGGNGPAGPGQNQPPALTAPEGQDVDAGTTVTLAATATDPEGDALSYTWTQQAGPDVGSLSGAQPSFTAPDEVVTLEFDVVASDGQATTAAQHVVVRVWDDFADAVFVATDGDDASTGTIATPVATIEAALELADAGGGSIYLGAGTYGGERAVRLRSSVNLYGGFDAGWKRDPATNVSRILRPNFAVIGDEVTDVRLDGLHIESTQGNADASQHGIILAGSQRIEITGNWITAAPGNDGVVAPQGGQGERGNPGGAGGAASACPPAPARGAGGTGAGFHGGGGGQGDAGGGGNGAQGGGSRGGGGGLGGAVGQNGLPGGGGGPGMVGAPGAGGGPSQGGERGESGGLGAGGGGGGGGGGGVVFACGGSGGGGGGGGIGGSGGLGGPPGGDSYGIMILSSDAIIRRNAITTGDGGTGGIGGAGGPGGDGGAGGAGGARFGAQGAGGNGGRGGMGGPGGMGGGGGGGLSVGIFERRSEVVATENEFTLGVGGAGGEGGNPGEPGTVHEHLIEEVQG